MEKLKRVETIYEAKNNGTMEGYDRLDEDERFIYETRLGEVFFGLKINEKYAAFINCRGKFFLVKKYRNCLAFEFGWETPTYDEVRTTALDFSRTEKIAKQDG